MATLPLPLAPDGQIGTTGKIMAWPGIMKANYGSKGGLGNDHTTGHQSSETTHSPAVSNAAPAFLQEHTMRGVA